MADLDAERLKELALSCQALNRDLAKADVERRLEMERESRESLHDMAIFARLLEATRANLNVMNRLRELRASRLVSVPSLHFEKSRPSEANDRTLQRSF